MSEPKIPFEFRCAYEEMLNVFEAMLNTNQLTGSGKVRIAASIRKWRRGQPSGCFPINAPYAGGQAMSATEPLSREEERQFWERADFDNGMHVATARVDRLLAAEAYWRGIVRNLPLRYEYGDEYNCPICGYIFFRKNCFEASAHREGCAWQSANQETNELPDPA